MNSLPLIDIRNLTVMFNTPAGELTAVDRVDLTLDRGETLGIVGESGCGKTVLAMSILGLLPMSRTRVSADRLSFDGLDLRELSSRRWRTIRGRRISIILQDPTTALNPLRTIGSQVDEAISIHSPSLSTREIRRRSIELMESVGIHDASETLTEYPHQWSGGMRQRALIVMAISNSPDVVIADEPTTALDVTIQAQVLELLRTIQKDRSLGMIFISHSLGVVSSMANRVSVMYAGRIVESGPCSEVLLLPTHPYSKALVGCSPDISNPKKRLTTIEGFPPRVIGQSSGCRFRTRCDVGHDRPDCANQDPSLRATTVGRNVACHVVESS